MRVIGYLRVSTKAQDDGFGKDAQKDAIVRFCKKNGHFIVAWVEDTISGVKEERDGLDTILSGKYEADAVVCFKFDRLARDTELFYYYTFCLRRIGLEVISTQEEVRNDDGFGKVILSLIQFCAEQERKNIMIRTSAGRKEKAKEGGYSGGRVPYGYFFVNGRWEIDSKEATNVKLIFGLRRDGLSLRAIADRMNERCRTREKKKWSAPTVLYILNNENTYRGLYRFGDMEWVKGQHEPILKEVDYTGEI